MLFFFSADIGLTACIFILSASDAHFLDDDREEMGPVGVCFGLTRLHDHWHCVLMTLFAQVPTLVLGPSTCFLSK
jgi:hypothetical protein